MPSQTVTGDAVCAADGWETVMITAEVRGLICTEQPEWASLVPARLLGRHVEAIVTHVADEQTRRRTCGLGAIEDSALLRVLFELPVGMAVPLSGLGRWERSVLSRSPRGAVAMTQSTVTRLACPAVRIEMVVVRARDWERGIYWASQFGPFCRRALVLSSMPADDGDRLLLEAGMFGIGVIIQRQAEEGWLVPPAPFRPRQASSGQWLFHERAYAGLRQPGTAAGHEGAGSGVVQPVLEGTGEGHLPFNVEG